MRNDRLIVDRRRFMQMAGAIAATPFAGNIMQAALAAGPFNDYRALVCVFLFGGNDSHNTIIPRGAEYAGYQAGRGNLAIPDANLVGINPTNAGGRSFGFHPKLTKLAGIFNTERKLAIISNAGVLLAPTTLAAYNARQNLPPQLFSHSDMQSHWQSGLADQPAVTGWGGRLADLLASANSGQVSVSISAAGQNLLMKGNSVVSYAISGWRNDPKNTIVRTMSAYRDWDNWAANRPNPQAIFNAQIAAARANVLEDQWGDLVARTQDTGQFVLSNLYNGPDVNGNFSEKSPVTTVFPLTYTASNGVVKPNRLAAQLRSVAMMIAARQALGVKRQIFFVSLGGFDTHGDQFEGSSASPPILSGLHSDLMLQLDDALAAFYQATKDLGVANNVTTFTMSDFGRTLTSNGKGSDHGWGGHYFALGGAVQGGAFYGGRGYATGNAANEVFPTVALKTGTDVDQGRLLPWTSVDEYGATFATWMGASAGELNTVFPYLSRFGRTNMGFLV